MSELDNVLRRSLFIKTETTPNHQALKFIPQGERVLETGTAEFRSYKDASRSPLAKSLFQIEGVVNVFFGPDFVTVNKNEDGDWSIIKPDVFSRMTDFYNSGDSIIECNDVITDTSINDDDSEVVQQIKEIIDTRVRPYVQSDGGEITYMVIL